MSLERDPRKAEANFRKRDVRFAESLPVFEDSHALTLTDDESDPDEQRFISLGMGARERVLVVVYSYRGAAIRIFSARAAEAHECSQYEESR